MGPQQRRAWLGWAFVYVVVLLFFSTNRVATLRPLIKMYGTEKDCTLDVELAALGLGLLQDSVCATFLAFTLWVVDGLLQPTAQEPEPEETIADVQKPNGSLVNPLPKSRAAKAGTFAVSWLLFMAMAIPFVADLLLVRIRDVRFNFDLVAMAIHEQNNASAMEVSSTEINEAYVIVSMTMATATLFAAVRASAEWADLSRWSPTQAGTQLAAKYFDLTKSPKYEQVAKSPGGENRETKLEEGAGGNATVEVGAKLYQKQMQTYSRHVQAVVVVLALVILPAIVLAISQACSALVAYAALNATINELFVHALYVTSQGFVPLVSDGTIASAKTYIHSATEEYTLFQEDSLYRRTTGFRGDLAFDVKIADDNPPNVVLIVVESFRFHDSHYLVGDDDPSNLFKGSNITVTPNFDKWAKRGVAFNNMWSSWRTSRSVESLLFGQVPYDSVADSGMSGGKQHFQLDGLPQFFKGKGYESFFTTGCKTDYDDWDTFLPSHGFETVWGRDEMKKLAESDLGITHDQWKGSEQRELYWGVHDDVSFQLLGDLMMNKTKEQGNRVANGEPKQPLFLTHYTISSHVSYEERPAWYAQAEKPDFSALYDGEDNAVGVKNYLEMRYFSDMELGKFMDRMSDAGVLNDTVVVIVGDHGQAPEAGNYIPEARDVSVTHVAGALVAEGRLGDAVGLNIRDATEQYDLLNTLADIVGVSDEGFLQDGVGRSLKRKVKFGDRVVYSNNPSRKMAVIRGTERLRYDRCARSVLLHDTRADHDMATDLFPDLTPEEQANWITWRDNGRRLAAYYKERWEKKCLLSATC